MRFGGLTGYLLTAGTSRNQCADDCGGVSWQPHVARKGLLDFTRCAAPLGSHEGVIFIDPPMRPSVPLPFREHGATLCFHNKGEGGSSLGQKPSFHSVAGYCRGCMGKGCGSVCASHSRLPHPRPTATTVQDFLVSVQDQQARLSPGVTIPEFMQLKAQYVVTTVSFNKWKTFFPQLFPVGYVASDDEYQTSFQLGWLLFLVAKSTLLGTKGWANHRRRRVDAAASPLQQPT